VVDVGGTTTDIGILQHGFPRQAAVAIAIGGVHTNFRMPDLLSLGLGGGSLVQVEGHRVSVRPRSAGSRLTTEARIFGGDTLTMTDIAVAAGKARLGDPARVRNLVSSALPVFELDHTMTPTTVNPLGVKGVGEAGTIGSTPAIAAAVADALGEAYVEMLFRPEKLWKIIHQRQ
jgi:hypothetical protein